MTPQQADQIIKVLKSAKQLDHTIPTHLERLKKIITMANQVKVMPGLPTPVRVALLEFYDGRSALPGVTELNGRTDNLIQKQSYLGFTELLASLYGDIDMYDSGNVWEAKTR